MGSFQQIVMGGICLVAVFLFGSYINEQPTDRQHPLQGVSSSFVDKANSHLQVPSQQQDKSQGGLLSSFLDASTKSRPVTLSDLTSRSMSDPSNVIPQNSGSASPVTTEVVSDFVKPPVPDYSADPSFSTNNHSAQVVSNHHSDQQRLEIIPDFSTLAEDFRREQAKQFRSHEKRSITQTASVQRGSLLPVPKLDELSRATLENPIQQTERDWNAVRQGVMSVEEKLKQFHTAHPVAEEFEPLRAEDVRLPVAATTTAGRFVPDARSIRQEEADRLESERLEESMREFERQELARQEIQRQEFLKRRPQAFIPSPSWKNSDRTTARSIPSNQLRTENQLAGRSKVSERRFEPTHRPAPSESFAQRQERWKVFGDRTREPRDVAASGNDRQRRFNQDTPVSRVRTAEMSAVPEGGRVKSLYSIPATDEPRASQLDRREQSDYQQSDSRSRKTAQLPRQRRTAGAPLDNDAGPEVIRYGDFKTYVTEGGDTLQTISQSFFGTPEYYFDLYLANRSVLANPATVPVGVELKIPRMGE